jgi:hypothetical protein
MSYAACPGHPFPIQSCEDCRALRPFDPSQNLELVALKSAWQDIGPGADDLPDPSLILTEGVDADGMVHARPGTHGFGGAGADGARRARGGRVISVPKPTPTIREPKRLTVKYRGIPEPVKRAVFARDDMTCQWCKVSGGALDAHHRLPRSAGGSDQGRFLVSVHRLCHRYIHEHPGEARERRFLVRSEPDLAKGWT